MSVQLPQQRLTVPGDVDERDFFTKEDGSETLVTHADLEQAVPNSEKPYLEEIQRYWVNKPYAFIVIYENVRDNELRYIVVEPRLSELERDIVNFFKDKLRTSLDYNNVDVTALPRDRAITVRNETLALMKRYNLIEAEADIAPSSVSERIKQFIVNYIQKWGTEGGMESVEESPAIQDEAQSSNKLNGVQVRRIIYYVIRDFIRYGRIDPIKNDVNIEDVTCNGYNSPVFVFHSEHGQQIVTNVTYGKSDLDDFVKTLAQSSGKGISQRQPNVDATLPDGSRAQLTLGTEISDHGTNFTIRQFNDIPFTPVDLINWRTFSFDQVVYLWLAIEHGKSIVFSGGTASGKTTSLNAMSLFMPSNAKIVSIEDTREVELPQRNWTANMTREAFHEGGHGEIDEFDLLEDALRKRPDYVIMGEVRGEEGQTLFQLLNTGHTTYTTFHADEPKEVVRRFTTDPINVAPSMFDALDIITIQANIDIGGEQVRRSTEIVEVNEYNASANKFSMNDAFMWDRKSDDYVKKGKLNILEQIKSENAWDDEELRREWNRRRLVLSYLVTHNINTYAGVAATLQSYMSSKDTILSLIADDKLESRIAALHQMQTIDIDVDPEREALIPRPSSPNRVLDEANEIIEETKPLLVGYDSADVDFARSVEQLLSGDELTADEHDLLDQLDESGADEALPSSEVDSGESEYATSSEDFRGDNVIDDALEEELAELFDESSEGGSEGQVVLTSETLERLNKQSSPSEQSAERDDNVQGRDDVQSVSDEIEGMFDDEDIGGGTEQGDEPDDVSDLFTDDDDGAVVEGDDTDETQFTFDEVTNEVDDIVAEAVDEDTPEEDISAGDDVDTDEQQDVDDSSFVVESDEEDSVSEDDDISGIFADDSGGPDAVSGETVDEASETDSIDLSDDDSSETETIDSDVDEESIIVEDEDDGESGVDMVFEESSGPDAVPGDTVDTDIEDGDTHEDDGGEEGEEDDVTEDEDGDGVDTESYETEPVEEDTGVVFDSGSDEDEEDEFVPQEFGESSTDSTEPDVVEETKTSEVTDDSTSENIEETDENTDTEQVDTVDDGDYLYEGAGDDDELGDDTEEEDTIDIVFEESDDDDEFIPQEFGAENDTESESDGDEE